MCFSSGLEDRKKERKSLWNDYTIFFSLSLSLFLFERAFFFLTKMELLFLNFRPSQNLKLRLRYTEVVGFFFFVLSDHNHQVDCFVAMVHAGYVCVAIIHRTLTWTTGSLTCAQMLMYAVAQGVVQAPKESPHSKLTLGRKSLAASGNRTRVNGVPVRWSTNWDTTRPELSSSLGQTHTCVVKAPYFCVQRSIYFTLPLTNHIQRVYYLDQLLGVTRQTKECTI